MPLTRRNMLAAGAAGAAGVVVATAPRAGAAGTPSTVLDVMQFGARGDGSDDRAAIQRAVNEAVSSGGPSPLVRLGVRHGLGGEIRVDRGITVTGGGSRATLVHPVNGYSGWLWTISNNGRNGQWQAGDETYNPVHDRSGCEMFNLHFNGLDRRRPSQGLRVLRADDLLLDNITFGFFNGTALQLGAGPDDGIDGGSVRESDLRRVKIYKSGAGPEVPGAVFQSSPTGNSDGTNQVYAHMFRYVYNHGGLLFRNDNPGEWVRRIQIDQMQLHGLTHGKSVGNVVDHDLVTFEGGLINIALSGVLANGSGRGRALFRSRANAAGTRPVGIKIEGSVSGCAGDVFVGEQAAAVQLDLYVGGGLSGDWVRMGEVNSYEVRLNGSTGMRDDKVKHPGRGTVTWGGESVTVARPSQPASPARPSRPTKPPKPSKPTKPSRRKRRGNSRKRRRR